MAAANPTDNIGPHFLVQVADVDLPADINRFVTKVEFESADGIADLGRLELANPNFVFSESKIFQPGNELNIYAGYDQLEFLGRVVIAKFRANYPQGDMPTCEVVGYSRDHQMMDHTPPALPGSEKKLTKKGKVSKQKLSEAKRDGRIFSTGNVAEMVSRIAQDYGFDLDIAIDVTLEGPRAQKAGQTDYDFVKGLANISGAIFWVDATPAGQWTMHFIDPKGRIGTSRLQDKQYTFHYGRGELSTLLSFEPEYAVRDTRTKIEIAIRDPNRGTDYVEIVEEEEPAPDVQSTGKAGEEDKVEGPIPASASLKLFFEEFSVEIIPNKGFSSAAEAKLWAEQWFRRHRENFITGSGTLVGMETLKARQVHLLSGLGTIFDGEYYFARVRHVLTNGGGYMTDFSARKHVAA